MEAYVTFFNRYIIVSMQLLIGFFFFVKCLRKKRKLFFDLLFAALGCLAMWVSPAGSIGQYLIFVLLLAAVGILIYRVDFRSVLFYAALAAEIMELSVGIVNSLSGILYPLAAPWHRNAAAIMSVLLGMTALALAALCYGAAHRYFLNGEMVEGQYHVMILVCILIPMLMLFFVDAYINTILYGATAVRNAGGSVIVVNHYQMLAIQIFGLASLFCILSAYKKMLHYFHVRTELTLLEQEEHFLNRYVEEARARYEKTASFRHDSKNHITVVKELLQSGRLEEALTYIGDLTDMTEELSFPCSTGNPVADILIGNKLGIAESMGIAVECSLLLPYPCKIRDIDFCIILSNALDNAIRACQEQAVDADKYIRVTGRLQGDFVLVEVENSFFGKRLFRMGTGLTNIKTTAEKYQGAMSIKTQDKTFLLSVLLVIPRHEGSIPRQNG